MSEKRVVICGAGIIGCATAYYLVKLGCKAVTVVERNEVAGHSSGKAGGFLALDWCDRNPLKGLARKSFDLHKQLENDLEADVGYRPMKTLSVSTGAASKTGGLPAWIDGKVEDVDVIGTRASTAQCHPKLLTRALLDSAVKGGAKYVEGKVTDVSFAGGGKTVAGVRVDDNVIPGDVVVVAMGPWSGQAREWLPKAGIPRISGGRAHSIVLDTAGRDITAHALFASVEGRDCEVRKGSSL